MIGITVFGGFMDLAPDERQRPEEEIREHPAIPITNTGNLHNGQKLPTRSTATYV